MSRNPLDFFFFFGSTKSGLPDLSKIWTFCEKITSVGNFHKEKNIFFLEWPGTDSVQKNIWDFLKNGQVQVGLYNMTLQIVYKVDMFSTDVAWGNFSPKKIICLEWSETDSVNKKIFWTCIRHNPVTSHYKEAL